MEFKDKIKKLREEKRLSQKAVADSIYVSRSAIAKWENGLGMPSKESLKLISKFYNVEEKELLKEPQYEEKLVSKNIQINRMKLSMFISFGLIVALVLSMIIFGFNNKVEPLEYPQLELYSMFYEGNDYAIYKRDDIDENKIYVLIGFPINAEKGTTCTIGLSHLENYIVYFNGEYYDLQAGSKLNLYSGHDLIRMGIDISCKED